MLAALKRPTLRFKLIAAVLAILLAIGVAIGAAAVAAVRASLIVDLDERLHALQQLAESGPVRWDSDRPPDEDVRQFLSAPGRGDGSLAAVVTSSGSYGEVIRARRGATVSLSPREVGQLRAIRSGDRPVTTDIHHLGRYRVTSFDASGSRVFVGLPLDDVEESVKRTAVLIAMAVGIGTIAAGFAAHRLITRQLRPFSRVAGIATSVATLDLETGQSALRTRVPAELSQAGTEVGDVGAALNLMLDHIDEALDARYASEQQIRRFVADASHELRTPLATIRGYTDLTRSSWNEIPPTVRQSLERIDAGAVRMSSLVEDLLLLARLDADRQPLELTDVDLTAMLVELVADAHVTSPDHVFTLDVPDEPLIVCADPLRAQQAITNVLANAQVHTPVGTHVCVRAAEAAGGQEVRVVISDDGPGIPAEILPRVFERFVRGAVGRSRSRGEQSRGGSSGLGLAITDALMQAMHGSAEVKARSDSGDAAGVTFTLTFRSGSGFTAAA